MLDAFDFLKLSYCRNTRNSQGRGPGLGKSFFLPAVKLTIQVDPGTSGKGEQVEYAGFWRRFGAYWLDFFCLLPLVAMIGCWYVSGMPRTPTAFHAHDFPMDSSRNSRNPVLSSWWSLTPRPFTQCRRYDSSVRSRLSAASILRPITSP